MNLWERKRARRRTQVIEAARDLVVEGGIEAISMRKLAAAAEVSVATLYNQFGAKEEIVEMAIEHVLGAIEPVIDPIPADEPFERARAIATASVDAVVADAGLYRPFIRALVQTGEERDRDLGRVWSRGLALTSQEVAAAMSIGELRDDVAPQLIAAQALRAFNSSMLAWAFGILDDAGFREEVLRGLYVCLLAVATEQSRPRLLTELSTLGWVPAPEGVG
ncbi:MAG: hypothetical protein JJLCMIEE_03010 [Acidimicrobiales bacterium]|nr:MAG: TetR/AcrR family transcriptional regulator [Actinomycetota bacterium]MBV6509895.1 hypothetical protein [Acidimicrobiales bacterium]RIK03287.1 MAG: hypothetical protein DCC48_16825 [Acidobacteriota bacterium]